MKIVLLISIVIIGVLLMNNRFINNHEVEYLNQEKIVTTTTAAPQTKSITINVSSNDVEQGGTLTVEINNATTSEGIIGKFDNKIFDWIKTENPDEYLGIIGIDVRKTPGDYSLIVSLNGEEKLNRKIAVRKGDFYVTKFVLTPELEKQGYTQANIVEKIQTTDGVLIGNVIGKYTSQSYFANPFVYPLDSIVKVGDFGVTRKTGDISLRHLGVDLDAKLNTPIYAINDGVVEFRQELTTYGKTIIIDHGFGIYSLYLHLNEFKVELGDKVKRGGIIGLSGTTGYSLEPHLHFSIKANGASVDPLNFIKVANSGF